MNTDTAAAIAEQPAPGSRYSLRLLVAGILARTWLWFVAGCVIVTLLPMLIGWRAFVVESSSMEPRLAVGDAVLAAPGHDVGELLGRVTVFTDPDAPGKTKVHRVAAINADGTLTTKGDANPTADSTAVPLDDVVGLGRLLVRYVGLPLVWLQTGQWDWLGLFVLSLLLAGVATSRDQEDEDEDADGPDDGPLPGLLPLPSRLGSATAALAAATKPFEQGLRRVVTSPRWVTRTAYVAVLASAVLLPTAGAAFAATTRNPANTWAAGSWTYTSTVQGLNPWLYWKLDETSGTTAVDSSPNGTRSGSYTPNANNASFTRGIVGANTSAAPNRAVTLTSANACITTASSSTMNAPAQITEIVWFKATSGYNQGGKLVGFEMPQTGVAQPGSGGTYDRHIYLDGAGKVWYGVYNGGYFTISSPGTYNDGAWHMAAASMGTSEMALYVDGVVVGTNANTAGESTTGWFRAGCGNLGGWGASWTGNNNPTTSTSPTQNRTFLGSLDEISIWQSVLTPAQIAQLYAAR